MAVVSEMALADGENIDQAARRLRVDTLIFLRWIAVGGQTLAVLGTYFYFNFDFPIAECFVAIATSASINIALRLTTSRSFRLSDEQAAILLGYDLLQLSSLLYLTGGLTNSFSMLLLSPIMISAVSLPRKLTFILVVFMIGCATLLTVDFMPLPWRPMGRPSFPLLYRTSILSALALSAAFISVYAARVSDEARLLGAALAATELVLEREQHLSQLDGLAAAAAHELGTPLATITLVTKELQKSAPGSAPMLSDDLALLAQEAARCREILRKLTSLSTDDGIVMNLLSLEALIEEVVGPQRDYGVGLDVVKTGTSKEPVCARNPGILYGLGNLVENAIDFAESRVRIQADWSRELVVITIVDDGPGFSPAILSRLGDPYVSGRSAERRIKTERHTGLGLGLFIAKTLLERSGATVHTTNVEPPRTGARVIISWPRSSFERIGAGNPRSPDGVTAGNPG
jgi:two-component system sensor histidine kinase RegB